MKSTRLFAFLVYFFSSLLMINTAQATSYLLPEDLSNTPVRLKHVDPSSSPEVVTLRYKKAKKTSELLSNCFYELDFTSQEIVTADDIRRFTSVSSQIIGLDLMESYYMDKGAFPVIGQLTNLVDLTFNDIDGCNDQTIIHISPLKKLEKLSITHTGVRAEGLEFLAAGSLPLLRVLNAGCNNLGNKGIEAISRFEGIEELDIHTCSFNDNALPYLTSMPNLKKVNISGNRISPSALQTFIQENAYRNLEVIAERLRAPSSDV